MKHPTTLYHIVRFWAQYCHTDLPRQRWCHCIQARIPVIESGSFRRYSPWLCPCTSSILLGTLVTHSNCLQTFPQLVSGAFFAPCSTSQISMSDSFFDQEPSELKCLEENSPDVANFFGKAPDTWTRTRGCILPGALQISDMT